MSVTFSIAGDDLSGPYMNLCNRNAADLLSWLGLDSEPCGQISGEDLVKACHERMLLKRANLDAALPTVTSKGLRGATFIEHGRDAGYLRERTMELLAIARQAAAQGREVVWG